MDDLLTRTKWQPLGEPPPPALLAAANRAPADGEELKKSPRRTTCRIQAEGITAIVKIHGRRGFLATLARLIGLDPARREARALTRALAAGLPVPRPLAHAADPGGGSRLLMEDLGPVTTLDSLLATPQGIPQTLVTATGELIAKLHQQGFHHGDLHTGNLVFFQDKLWLLDLQSVRATNRPLSPHNRKKSLVTLWLSARGQTRPGQGRIFLAAYLRVFPWPGVSGPDVLAPTIAKATKKFQLRAWRRREDRPFRNCSEFTRQERAGRVVISSRGPNIPEVDAVLAAIDQPQAQLLRAGRRGRVIRAGGWIIKERDRAHAKKLWLAIYRLGQRQLPGPEGLLLILEKDRGLVVTTDLGPLPEMNGALATMDSTQVIQCAARMAAQLHSKRLGNRDMKSPNLLVAKEATGLTMIPVDLDGLTYPCHFRQVHICRDLTRLCCSLLAGGGDPKEFMDTYLREAEKVDLPGRWRRNLSERVQARVSRAGPRP